MVKEGVIGIYKITNKINNKCYIGQSINIERRFEEHKNTNRTSKYLHRAMIKYGIDNFKFEIIEICHKEELSEKEKYWINYYHSISPYGYNLTDGGDGGNTFRYRTEEQMEETKKKISNAVSGENNGFFGKHHSEKTKEKLKQINIGKKLSQETKNKISESLQNHIVTNSTKQKISEATKKQWNNKEFKDFMKLINTGNNYAKGNTWNKGRIDVYHKDTHIHKRIYSDVLQQYINEGYIQGIPLEDKRHNPTILHCTKDKPIGICFNQKNEKWIAYINFQKKRYGVKSFYNKEEAIKHRIYLENMFLNFINSNIDISNIDVKKSLKTGQIVLWCD